MTFKVSEVVVATPTLFRLDFSGSMFAQLWQVVIRVKSCIAGCI